MIIIDESSRNESAESILHQYAKLIDRIGQDSLDLILLPEKIASITNDGQLQILVDAAKKNNVAILVGISRENRNEKLNQALLLTYGNPAQIYTKVNLYEGEAFEGFSPGHSLGEGSWRNESIGLVVCKDMDFDQFIRRYQNAVTLLVPAWDFVRDDWLHSRMAIMRGIENGFSIARNARQGRLTITNYAGKVLHEISSADGKEHLLIGQLPVKRIHTLYSKIGNLFGLLDLIAACWILILLFRKKSV
jgi:apolipoprotein N-acyltransferase